MTRSVYEKAVTGSTGNIIVGATATVRNQSDNELASIYSAISGGSPIAGSVVTTGSDGYIKFYVEPGVYRITIAFGDVSREFQNVEIGAAIRGSSTIFDSLRTESFMRGKVVDVAVVDGEATIDWSLGTVYRMNIVADTDLYLTNMPSVESGEEQTIYFDVRTTGARTLFIQSTYDLEFPLGINTGVTPDGRDIFVCACNDGEVITVVPLTQIGPGV
jgi:hypothetical protein